MYFLVHHQILAKIYDEFLMRKKTEMDTSAANDESFTRALELILEVTPEKYTRQPEGFDGAFVCGASRSPPRLNRKFLKDVG